MYDLMHTPDRIFTVKNLHNGKEFNFRNDQIRKYDISEFPQFQELEPNGETIQPDTALGVEVDLNGWSELLLLEDKKVYTQYGQVDTMIATAYVAE